MSTKEDVAHAVDLLREANDTNRWDGCLMIGVDPVCCFGRAVGRDCGKPSEVAVALEEVDKTGIHLILLCTAHAEAMKEAISVWRGMQAKGAQA